MSRVRSIDNVYDFDLDLLQCQGKRFGVFFMLRTVSVDVVRKRPEFVDMDDEDWYETGYDPFGGIEVSYRFTKKSKPKGCWLFPVKLLKDIFHNCKSFCADAQRINKHIV